VGSAIGGVNSFWDEPVRKVYFFLLVFFFLGRGRLLCFLGGIDLLAISLIPFFRRRGGRSRQKKPPGLKERKRGTGVSEV